MPDAQELYSKTVYRLSPKERLRLASLILDGLAHEQEHAGCAVLDLLEALPEGGRLLKTPAEADSYLREERDSWDL